MWLPLGSKTSVSTAEKLEAYSQVSLNVSPISITYQQYGPEVGNLSEFISSYIKGR